MVNPYMAEDGLCKNISPNGDLEEMDIDKVIHRAGIDPLSPLWATALLDLTAVVVMNIEHQVVLPHWHFSQATNNSQKQVSVLSDIALAKQLVENNAMQ